MHGTGQQQLSNAITILLASRAFYNIHIHIIVYENVLCDEIISNGVVTGRLATKRCAIACNPALPHKLCEQRFPEGYPTFMVSIFSC